MRPIRTALLISISILLGSPNFVFAIDGKELNERLDEMAAQQGITDKEQLEALKMQVSSILRTKEHFSYRGLKEPCQEDFERFCTSHSDVSGSLVCIKENRDSVTKVCEEALRNQFGSRPLKESQVYNGVLIPKGSTFFYDPMGNVLGIQASENFIYKNINFKKGQIRFHDVGISVGHLVTDQYIDGIKYKADGIGPFFNKDGEVENATLAEDTEIGGILYKGSAQIEYYSQGKVKMGVMAKDAFIQGESYEAGKPVWFKKDGTIRKL